MFQSIQESEDRKLRAVQALATIVAVAILAAVVLFFAFAPYARS